MTLARLLLHTVWANLAIQYRMSQPGYKFLVSKNLPPEATLLW
jgi:hypothetical protein